MVTSTRDPDATRLRILEAASQVFAADGPEGARVDAIAAAAKVNKRMLYHYFRDKDGLFAAVVAHRLRDVIAAHGSPSASRLELDEVSARLMIWAATRHVLPDAVTDGLRRLVEDFRAAAQEGRVRHDVDASTMVIVSFAVSLVLALLPRLSESLLAGDPATDGSLDPRAQLERLWRPQQTASGRQRHVPRPRIRMMPEVRGR